MTPRQIANYVAHLSSYQARQEARDDVYRLVAHNIDRPAVLATLKRDIDAGYRIAHNGWDGTL